MSQVITASFEDGVFKPDEPLDLPAHARVRLVVVPEGETPEETARQAARREVERPLNDPNRRDAAEELDRILEEFPIDSGLRMTRDELHDRS